MAVYGRAELKRLVENITSLIDNIEILFPEPQAQISLVRQDVKEISDRVSLGLIEEAAELVDGRLKKAAKEVLTGHQYLNVGIRGQAHNGDAYNGDWSGNAVGKYHTYDGVEVGIGGKALNGNKYGGKDFWDE